jgi:hypothetical protein
VIDRPAGVVGRTHRFVSTFTIDKPDAPNAAVTLAGYSTANLSWELGVFSGTNLKFASCSNTTGFGDISAPPPTHRFWVGSFDGSGKDNMLFFNQADENWFLGTFANGKLTWNLAMNSKGFGGAENGGSFFVGDFGGVGRKSVFFYFAQDGDWLLGTFAGSKLSFNRAANTAVSPANQWQFGYIANDPFFLGSFGGTGTSVVFLHEDGHWWQGNINKGTMSWQMVAATASKAW